MEYDTSINKNKVIGSLWWKILERFTSQGLNLVIQIVLARVLLPEDFGSLAIITAIISYCSVFVQSGLATSIIQKEGLDDKDVSTLLTCSLAIAALLYVVLFFLSPYISDLYKAPDLIWPLRIQSLVLFLGAINSIQTALFSRKMQFKSIFFRSILSVPISGAIGIVMAVNGYGIWSLVAQCLSSYLITIVYMSFDPITHIRLGFYYQRAKMLYSFSIKILFSGMVSTLGDTLRTMIIGRRYKTSMLAYYDKGMSYSSLTTQIITTSISSVMLPTLSRQQDNKEKLLAMSRTSIRIIGLFVIPLLTTVIAVAHPLVEIVLTNKWLPCVPYLMIFCVLRMPGCITNIDKQVYYAMGNSSILMYYEILLLVANILVLFITVPISVFAIAIGATSVEIFGNFCLCIVSSRFYGYTLRSRFHDLRKTIMNSVILFIIIYSVNLFKFSSVETLIIQLAFSIPIYFFLAWVTKDEALFEIIDILRRNKN